MKIDGIQYSLFKDYDKGKYKHLTFSGKVTYLDARVDRILIRPCASAMKTALQTDLGLILVTAICAGISAASTYLKGQKAPHGKDEEFFLGFVRAYMDPVLQEPAVGSLTWAEWLYKHVRCGLAHNFTIETGGVEYEASSYVELKSYGPEVRPQDLLADFSRGWSRFLDDVIRAGPGQSLGALFVKRFDEVFKD